MSCICSLEEHTTFPGKCDKQTNKHHSPVRGTVVNLLNFKDKEFFKRPKGSGKEGPRR